MSVSEDVGNRCALLVRRLIGIASVEDSLDVLEELKIELPFYPTISLLGIHRKEMKSLPSRDICTLIVVEALFIIVKM